MTTDEINYYAQARKTLDLVTTNLKNLDFYVFGSFARRKFHPNAQFNEESDLDILIGSENKGLRTKEIFSLATVHTVELSDMGEVVLDMLPRFGGSIKISGGVKYLLLPKKENFSREERKILGNILGYNR